MCEKLGVDGKVKANWVGETVVGFVMTGREGRMRPNGGGVDICLLRSCFSK